jgi:Zn-dependent alcohol dehydrogenase
MPQQGQILVKVIATGICHTDTRVQSGVLGNPFPIVLGYETIGDRMAVGAWRQIIFF